jgi:8-oxo-dGTP pyrophosphatase MutT (NUDIX family)
MLKKWKTLSSEYVFKHKWFKVLKEKVENSSGKVVDDYYLWDRGDVVLIVALTSDKKILLVNQYKHGGRDFFIEVPAGWVDEDENVEIAAKRELKEETGYNSLKFELLATLIGEPTKKIGKTYVYLAKEVNKTSSQNFDENEDIEVSEYSIDDVLDMIYSGRIVVPGTIAAIFLTLKKIGYKI